MSDIVIDNVEIYTIVETFKEWISKDNNTTVENNAVREYTRYLLLKTSERLCTDLQLTQREINYLRYMFGANLIVHLHEGPYPAERKNPTLAYYQSMMRKETPT